MPKDYTYSYIPAKAEECTAMEGRTALDEDLSNLSWSLNFSSRSCLVTAISNESSYTIIKNMQGVQLSFSKSS